MNWKAIGETAFWNAVCLAAIIAFINLVGFYGDVPERVFNAKAYWQDNSTGQIVIHCVAGYLTLLVTAGLCGWIMAVHLPAPPAIGK